MSEKRAKQLVERAKKTSEAAHTRIVKDATVQFRLDQENMERLLKIADQQRTGVGVVCRNWVLDRLQKREKSGVANEDVSKAIIGNSNLQTQLTDLKREVNALKKSLKLGKTG